MRPYIELFGNSYPAYGVMCALGIITALAGGAARARAHGLSAAVMLLVFTSALCAGLAGALVLYAFVTYGASGLWDMLSRGAFADEFAPGFVFYGGLLPGLAGAYYAAKACRARFGDYARALTPFLPLAHAFGRAGCFLAGCCYGVSTSRAWGVCYPIDNILSSAPKGVPLAPVQLIEAALLVLLSAILFIYTRKPRRLSALCVYALIYAPIRFGLEFMRGDDIRGAMFMLSTSQWLSIALWLAALAYAARAMRGKYS